jgi:hypothetical protein
LIFLKTVFKRQARKETKLHFISRPAGSSFSACETETGFNKEKRRRRQSHELDMAKNNTRNTKKTEAGTESKNGYENVFKITVTFDQSQNKLASLFLKDGRL